MVKKSTTWLEDTGKSFMMSACNFPFIMWQYISKCFVLSWHTRLAVIWMALWLSQNKIGSLEDFGHVNIWEDKVDGTTYKDWMKPTFETVFNWRRWNWDSRVSIVLRERERYE